MSQSAWALTRRPAAGSRSRIPGAALRHPGLRLPRRPGTRRAPRRAGRPAVLAGRPGAHHPLPVHHAAAADPGPAVVHPLLRAADPGPWDVRTSLLLEAAAMRSGLADGLSSLEMRTRPDAAMEELLAWVRSAEERRGTGERRARPGVPLRQGTPGRGVPGGAARERCRHDRRPVGQCLRVPLRRFFAAQRALAVTSPGSCTAGPETLHVVRGMDICADELAITGLGVPAPGHYVRQAAISGARWLSGPARRPALPVADDRARRGGLLSSAHRAAPRGRGDRGPRPARR